MKLLKLIPLLLCLLLLSGCIPHTELDKVAIAQILAVDKAGAGYKVSLQYFNMEKPGGNAIIDETASNVITVSAEGKTPGEAISEAERASGRSVTLGSLVFLVVGESVCDGRLGVLLDLAADSWRASPGIYVAAALGKASDITAVKFRECYSSAEKLRTILNAAEEKGECSIPKLFEARDMLALPTKSLVLPLIGAVWNDNTGDLSEDGGSVVLEGGLLIKDGETVRLTREEMSGLALLSGRAETLELFTTSEDAETRARIYDIKTSVRGRIDERGILRITAGITAGIRTGGAGAGNAARLAEDEIRRRIAYLYENFVKKYGADVCGLRYSLDMRGLTQELLKSSELSVKAEITEI